MAYAPPPADPAPNERRRLLLGHPDIEARFKAAYDAALDTRQDHGPEVGRVLKALDRLTAVAAWRRVLVLGCGPRPDTVRYLHDRGLEAVGVEPVPGFVRAAGDYLHGHGTILEASAESVPVPDGSQDCVLAETVLEHVDSLDKSFAELYRILKPGGLLYIYTTNRLKFSLVGRAEEYNVRFYNWLPALVKECYVHQHLHFDPTLANYSARPAVHWYSFAELCALGRRAGFYQFYSTLDLVDMDDRTVAASRVKRWLLRKAQRSPWWRALALTQYGGAIIMCKREG